MLVPSTTISSWHRRRERKWRILLVLLFLFGVVILAKADAVVPWIDLVHPRSASIGCRDSIILRWSRPLSSLPQHSRALVQSSAGVVRIASDDSTIVIAPPDGGWREDAAMVHAEVSALTGVATDDRRWSLALRRAMWVQCVARCDGYSVAPEAVARAIGALSTTVTTEQPVPIPAPGKVGARWRFREWRFCDSSLIRRRDEHSIVVDAPCWDLRDTLVVEAVYEADTLDQFDENLAVLQDEDDPSHEVNADLYRLKIVVTDVDRDARFNVGLGIEIVPGSIFEDQQERLQTVCVRASQCWEIVGYVDGKGKTTFVDATQEYCGSWLLARPTAIVHVLVQRRTMRLRIERLCRSQQANIEYDPHCHPHSDGSVHLFLERKAHGYTLWIPQEGNVCGASLTDSREWLVRCGDRLRIAVRDQPSRALHWYGWLAAAPYSKPEYVGYQDGAHWYEMLVQMSHVQDGVEACNSGDQPLPTIVLRALYDQGLAVESLALRVRANNSSIATGFSFEERWFDALRLNVRSSDEPADGRQLEYLPGKGTSVVVRFTRPVDLTTINAGGLAAASYDNVHPRFPDRSTSFETRSQFDERLIVHYDAPNVPARTFEFFIMEPGTTPRKHALYMGEVLLEAATSLRATNGTFMARKQQFVLSRLEYPGAAVRLLDVAIGGIDGDGGTIAAIQGFSATSTSARNQDVGFRVLPECDDQTDCTMDADQAGIVNMNATFAVFEPYGLTRSEELNAVLWTAACASQTDVQNVRNAATEVLHRSADVLVAHYALAGRTSPAAARQAVYHAARVDFETTHSEGIHALHWSFIDVAAERLRRPLRASTGGAVPWTYDVRLYPRKAVLD